MAPAQASDQRVSGSQPMKGSLQSPTAWQEPASVEVLADFAAEIGGHPLLAETLVRRGFTSVEAARRFMDHTLYTPAAASDLPGMQPAVRRLEYAIRRGEPVCVWGDFDVDGQTAAALLVQALRGLGAQVTYHIPLRETESHGLNVPWLMRLLDDGARLVLTCDTGITAHEAIAYAGTRSVDVIVTDHHLLPPQLPAAYAAINPQMLPPAHPLRTLPGVGVAYMLACELCRRAGHLPLVEECLDLVALGIVADVATLSGDTRYLLQRGLAALRTTERLGLRTLIARSGLEQGHLTEEHIGYVLAPRLNSMGRLADANQAVEFLLTTDQTRAGILADVLEGLNARRKLLCDQVYGAAEAQIAQDRTLLDRPALVLDHPAWPAGVIGIVAGRLAEKYGKPALLIAASPGGPARGSARSVPGCDITAAIAAQGKWLAGFGGHAMAGGFAIDPVHIPEFRRGIWQTLAATIGDEPVAVVPQADGHLPLDRLTWELVEDLERLAPFGPGNPRPTWISRAHRVTRRRHVGSSGEHLLLGLDGQSADDRQLIWWGGTEEALPLGSFDLAYSVRASNYRGQPGLQIEWMAAAQAGEDAESASPAEPTEIVDYRRQPDLHAAWRLLPADAQLQVWGEGPALPGPAVDRNGLVPSPQLAIWTAPPGRAELRAALETVRPGRIYLFAVDPGLDQAELFLRHLAGLAKYALRAREGRVSLAALAAATAQRTVTVRAGLAWLAARGHITWQAGEEEMIYLGMGSGRPAQGMASAEAELLNLLAETAAYRAYIARVGLDVALL